MGHAAARRRLALDELAVDLFDHHRGRAPGAVVGGTLRRGGRRCQQQDGAGADEQESEDALHGPSTTYGLKGIRV